MRASLATLLAVGALSSSSCVESDGSVFIEGVIPVNAAGDCEASSGSTVFQAGGVLDLAANTGYTAALKVRTNLPSTFSSIDLQQAKTSSPNYPSYGNIDNNVLIFEGAKISFSFSTDADTMQRLIDTAETESLNFKGELTCRKAEGTCDYGERESVASGSVFNPQTSLNGSQAVFTEAIPAELAAELLRLYREAAKQAGVASTDNPEADVSREVNLLQVPALRQSVTAKLSLVGTTTGGAKVASFPFPYPVDLCIGCLSPDQTVCDEYDAVLVEVPDDAREGCFIGVDAPTAGCSCVDEDGEPNGEFVNRDRTICSDAP